MKVRINFQVTRLKKMNDWAFLFTPAIFIARKDIFSDEALYYVGLHWLLFRFIVQLITKK